MQTLRFFAVVLLLGLTGIFDLANAQEAKVLDNDEIINLVSSGLPSSIVIKKIQSSPNKFDVSTDGLISLTKAEVPEEIIAAMMEAGENKVSEHHALIAQFDEAGIYYLEDDDSGVSYLAPSVIDKVKEGSFGSHMAGALTAAAKKKVRAIVTGDEANLPTSKKPIFFFYFGDQDDTAEEVSAPQYDQNNPMAMLQAMQNMNTAERIQFSGINSPNEIRLVKTDVKKNERQFVASSASGMTRETGIDSDYVVSIKYDRLTPGLYKVYTETPLEPGEYLFVYAGVPLYSGQYVYDFSVR